MRRFAVPGAVNRNAASIEHLALDATRAVFHVPPVVIRVNYYCFVAVKLHGCIVAANPNLPLKNHSKGLFMSLYGAGKVRQSSRGCLLFHGACHRHVVRSIVQPDMG